jgi:uncharacterized protein
MSKPESTGAKSLEEILASIRKSLADEAGGRPPEPRPAPAKPAQPQPQLAQPQLKPAAPASAPAKATSVPVPAMGVGPLAAKLAGAVNGAAGGPSLDADLSELLASDPKKPTLSMPADAGKPGTDGEGDDKDPLWFLTRLSAAASGPAAGGSAARARDAAKAVPTAKVDDVKLSRPETLRPSLPPLFDAKTEPAPGGSPAPSAKPADAAGTTERTQPRFLRPAEDAPANKDAPKETARDGTKDTARAWATASPTAAEAKSEAKSETAPAAGPHYSPRLPDPTADKAAAAASAQLASLTGDTAPAAGAAGLKLNNAPEILPTLSLSMAPSDAAAATGALQTRGLEQMVAELLEPVIRQWLQTNLPRMIEKVVREEVARVVASEREAGKH